MLGKIKFVIGKVFDKDDIVGTNSNVYVIEKCIGKTKFECEGMMTTKVKYEYEGTEMQGD